MLTEHIFLGFHVRVFFIIYFLYLLKQTSPSTIIFWVIFFVCLEINFHTKIYYCINSNYSNVHYNV